MSRHTFLLSFLRLDSGSMPALRTINAFTPPAFPYSGSILGARGSISDALGSWNHS